MGLAERDGVLYLAGKNYSDGWALATSRDEGVTIQPLSRYEDVRGVRACAQGVCSGACEFVASQGVWAQRRLHGRAAGRGVASTAASRRRLPGGCGCAAANAAACGGAASGAGSWVLALALALRSGRAQAWALNHGRFPDGDPLDSRGRAV